MTGLDVVKHIRASQIAGFVDALADAPPLQAAEERFHHGIVSTLAFAAHAGIQAMGLTKPLEVIAAVLAALIGMHSHGLHRLALLYRRHQSIQCELPAGVAFIDLPTTLGE